MAGTEPTPRATAFAGSAAMRAMPALVFALLLAVSVAAVERRGAPAPATLALRLDATADVEWAVTLDGRAVAPTSSDERAWRGDLPGDALGTLRVHAHPVYADETVALRLRAESAGIATERVVWGDHAVAELLDLAPTRAHGEGCLHDHGAPGGAALPAGGHDHGHDHAGHDHE